LADVLEETADQLRGLALPAGDEDILNRWLSTGGAGVDLTRELAIAIEGANRKPSMWSPTS
jgi:hypothetical protein